MRHRSWTRCSRLPVLPVAALPPPLPFFVSLLRVQPWNRGYGGGGYGGDGWCVSLPLLLSFPLLQLLLGGGCEGVGEPGEWHWGGGCDTWVYVEPRFGGDDEEYNSLKQKLASPSQKSVRLPPSSSGSAASSASNRDAPAAGAAASVTKADVKKTDVPLESARTAANVLPAIITAPIVRPDIFSDAAATSSATAAAPDPSADASNATGSISRKASNESRTNESVQAGNSGADETGSKEGSLHARQAGTSKRVAFALPSLETGEPAKGFTKAVGGAADGDGGDKREAGDSPLPAVGSRPSESQPSNASSPSTSPPAENPIESALAVASDWLRRQGIGARAVAAIDHAIHNMGPAAQGAAQAGRQLWAAHGRQAVGEVMKWPMLAHVCIGVGLTFLLCQTGFFLSLLLLPWAVLYFWLLWAHHYERLKVAVRAAVRIEQLMSRAMPEAETAFWASVLLSKAWPLFLNDLVSTKLMPKVAPWFLSRYKPPMLAKVEVVKANFGDTAPVITSIKVFREGGGRNHVELEASVELVGADNLSVQATAYVAGMASIPWTAYITGLQLTGTMRVGLRFRRSLPFVDRVTLSFVRPPQVSCAIKVMGALDAASMPLVASYVDYTIQNALKTSLCWPNRLVVVDAVRAAAFVLDLPVPPPTPEEISIVTPRPVTKGKSTLSAISKKFLSKKGKDGTTVLPAVATLLVEVIEAKDLLAADSGGTSDPYVKGSIGAARFQTAVISKNLNPQWKQKFEVPVADWSLPESYTLILRVKDYDMFSANDAIGRAQMDISAVRGAGRKEEWVPLVDGGKGKIRVAVEVREEGGIGASASDSDPAGPSASAAAAAAAAGGGRRVERAASDASTCTRESYSHDSQSVSPARSEDAARAAAPTTATVIPRSSTSEDLPSESLPTPSSSSTPRSTSWFRGLSSTGRGSRNGRTTSSSASSQLISLEETAAGATTPKENAPAAKTPKEGTPRSGSRSWSFKSGSLRRLGSGAGASLGIAVATVHVEVIEADSLVAADKIGTSDPYLKGSLGSSKFSTKIIFKTLCPRWNEKFLLPVKEWPPAGSPFLLKLNVFDRDMLTQHDPLGSAALDIMPLRDGARHALWMKLENVTTGRVHVAVTVEDHMGQAESDDEENESVEGGEEGGDGKAGVNSAPTGSAQVTPAPESPSQSASRSSKKQAGKGRALTSIPSGEEPSAMAAPPAASSYGPSSPPPASDSPVAGKGGTGEAGEAGAVAERGWESDAQAPQGVEEVPQVWVAHVEIIEATDLVVADMTGDGEEGGRAARAHTRAGLLPTRRRRVDLVPPRASRREHLLQPSPIGQPLSPVLRCRCKRISVMPSTPPNEMLSRLNLRLLPPQPPPSPPETNRAPQIILAVAASFFFIGTFWLLLGIAVSTISWVGVATRRETITLGPDAFSIVHTRYGVSKKREGSTHFIHSILVVDRNAPRLLPPPHSTTAPGIPVPGSAPPSAAAPAAAASGSAPTAWRGPAAAAAAANARARETPAEPPELLCVIALPDTVHRFGANLSEAEKYWVVGELSYYLRSVRLHPAQWNV
ncbi:unnamed protein product [Closterium sp. NIES-53]